MDIDFVVEKLAAQGYIRASKITGEWYTIYCPFHNNGQERKPSCGVSRHTQVRGGNVYPEGLFHCFSCQTSLTLVDGLTRIFKDRGFVQTGVEWLQANVPDFEIEDDEGSLIPSDMMEAVLNRYALDDIKAKTNQPEQTYISEEELATYRFTVPYMYERGLTDELIEKYDIGVDMNWVPPGKVKKVPCITFPVRDIHGRTLFLCRRSISGKMYNYPEGVVKPVYGIDMIPPGTKSVLIAESCINVLTGVKYGYPSVGLLGTGNDYQMKQLKELGVYEYVICTDGDDAGRRAAKRLHRALSSVAMIWTIPMPDGKDLNDIKTKEEFDELYAQRY